VFSSAWLANLTEAKRSSSLEIKLKCEIGGQELKVVGSRVGFFRRCSTIARFSEAGTTPAWNEQLHKDAMTGAIVTIVSLSCFSNQVGIESSWHVLDVALASDLSISSLETGSN